MKCCRANWVLLVIALVTGSIACRGAEPVQETVPPADAQWTILCEAYTGSNHQYEAHQAKDFWASKTNFPGFYVIHQQDQSTLYYGYYRTINDPKDRKESERAQDDRQRLMSLVDSNGERPFLGCLFVELVPKDPPAPAEWNLANAKGHWSLQVAVYEDDPRRKQYAVDAVRDMRAHGIKDAYFFHGATASSVCIGAWPDEAVKVDQPENSDPNQPVLVTNQLGMAGDLYLKSTGQKVQQITPHVEVLDPKLKAEMTEYPYEAINGDMEVRDGNGKLVKAATPSYLVEIPHDQASDAGTTDSASDANANTNTQLPPAFVPPPPPPTDSTTGGLRSMDSK
ncbi:MAG TPA: hypothetical protein VGG19_16705 [Tepidisphaeraceae bacterium]|jgi:hypothetical protein